MFIHIGGDTVVSSSDVIAIFDIEAQDKPATKAFLDQERALGRVEVVDVAELKSFIITNTRVYFSPISSLTLRKRAYLIEPNAKQEIDSSTL